MWRRQLQERLPASLILAAQDECVGQAAARETWGGESKPSGKFDVLLVNVWRQWRYIVA